MSAIQSPLKKAGGHAELRQTILDALNGLEDSQGG